MPTKTTNYAEGVRWDLSDLYRSPDDSHIEKDLALADRKARALEEKYQASFQNAGQNDRLPLGSLLKDYKEIAALTTKLGVFAYLSFAERTNDPAAGAFLQKINVRLTDIQTHLVFFEVAWNRLDEKIARRYLEDPALADDRHFLEKARAFAPHTLAVGEEKIMAIKSNTSGGAFRRLFDETMNNIPFFIEIEGRKSQKNESEILSFLQSSERALRKKASESLADGLASRTRLLCYIFNMVLADHRASMKIRHHAHPMEPMNLSNEIDFESVKNLIHGVKAAYPLAQRYYRLKKKLLGYDHFFDYDRHAPIGQDGARYDFGACRRIVLEGYYAFSNEVGKILEEFFDHRWIDAQVREGKQGGGFCCPTTPGLHPYILVNYTGTARDVMTVAHELGHGLHQQMARRAGILEMSAPLTMAETASVFGEMLIFEKIYSEEKDREKRLALLCGKIEDNFATVFRQVALTDFELAAHEAGLKEEEMASERLSDFWIKANADYYGASVEFTPGMRHGWKYISHFIHAPFYCYAYAFAQLYVLSLFQKYREDKKSFIPNYLEMLALGGSKKPEEIASIAGLDIHAPNFWQSGILLLERLVDEAEQLAGDKR